MKSVKLIACIVLVNFSSCTSNQTIEARIYERKYVEDNKLMIKYKYDVSGKSFRDSAVIENRTLEDEMIHIQVDKNDHNTTTYIPEK